MQHTTALRLLLVDRRVDGDRDGVCRAGGLRVEPLLGSRLALSEAMLSVPKGKGSTRNMLAFLKHLSLAISRSLTKFGGV